MLQTSSMNSRVWLIILLLCILFAYLALSTSGAWLVASLQGHTLFARVLTTADSRLKLTVLAALVIFGIPAIWFLLRRQLAMFVLTVAVAVVVSGLFTNYKFHRSYPRADLFGIARLKDAFPILLGSDVRLTSFRPEPMLKVERKVVEKAAFPIIDVHFHLTSLPPSITAERMVQAMDAAGIRTIVNLDAGKAVFAKHAREFSEKYPDRFIMFVKPDVWAAVLNENGVAKEIEWMREAARMGARGVKVNKGFGLTLHDKEGKLVAVDDPRFDPIWEEAGRLGLPVLLHTADPPAFFTEPTNKNERFEELLEFPEWGTYGPEFPTFKQLMEQRERLLARHPKTIFIGAHIGSSEDDLSYAASMLDRFPNFYVDTGARVAGLGRQPVTARAFLIKYQDRVLFASDGGYGLSPTEGAKDTWTPERFYRSYIEFFETTNEYIEYPLWGVLNQGRWRVQGVDLPRDVLEKLYVRNAERLLPSAADVRARLAPVVTPPVIAP